VVAIISSEAFHLLDAPPRRICAQDTPIPVQPDLYAAHRPHAADVVTAVLETVRY
jgi:acetoin:2,6-dichlorophenolindophenol oxidoreductase subunit beta